MTLFALLQVQLRLQLTSDAAEERPGRTVDSRDFCSSDAAEERPGRTVASRLTVISAVRSLDQLRLANLSPHWPSVQTARVEHDSAMAVYMVLACCDKNIEVYECVELLL